MAHQGRSSDEDYGHPDQRMYYKDYDHPAQMMRDEDYDYRTNQKITRDEAEDILSDAKFRDFWCVEYQFDNCLQLQKAVDRIYNTIPGNNYEVDYMNNQNGCRLMIRCVICKKELTSLDPFLTHEKGKPHKKVRQQHMTITNPNIKGEFQRKPHNTTKGIFKENSLEDMIDMSKSVILGVQFVYKVVTDGKNLYTCHLCQSKNHGEVTTIRKKDMYKHLKSRDHLETYVSAKFGESRMFTRFQDIIEDIEKLEGKIHAPIVDFSKHILIDMKKKGIDMPLKKQKKRRSSSSSSGSSHHSVYKKKKERYSVVSSDVRDPSPRIFREEDLSPLPSPPPLPASPPPPPPPPPPPINIKSELPPRAVLVDKGTSTDIVNRTSFPDLIQGASSLLCEEATSQLLEDSDMQKLLHEVLYVLNRQVMMHYKENNTICKDEQGHFVSQAVDCAVGLEDKHIRHLKVLTLQKPA